MRKLILFVTFLTSSLAAASELQNDDFSLFEKDGLLTTYVGGLNVERTFTVDGIEMKGTLNIVGNYDFTFWYHSAKWDLESYGVELASQDAEKLTKNDLESRFAKPQMIPTKVVEKCFSGRSNIMLRLLEHSRELRESGLNHNGGINVSVIDNSHGLFDHAEIDRLAGFWDLSGLGMSGKYNYFNVVIDQKGVCKFPPEPVVWKQVKDWIEKEQAGGNN